MSKRTRARALNSYPDLLLGLYTHANCIRLCDTISELFDAAAAAGRTARTFWRRGYAAGSAPHSCTARWLPLRIVAYVFQTSIGTRLQSF